LDHFSSYNKFIAEPGITFDLERLQERFDRLVKKCMVKDLTLAVFDLGFELKCKRADWINSKKFYSQLIDICLDFQESSNSFSEAFFSLECKKNALTAGMGASRSRTEDLCKNLSTIINNYRGLITKKCEAPAHSIFLRHSRDEIISSSREGLDIEAALAKALHRMLSNPENNKKLAEIAKKCLEEYKPLGYETIVSGLNPISYFRARGPALEHV
jgi:hypothetical protein